MENNLKIEGYELLNQKVYRLLKEAIIKGFLEPGTKLLSRIKLQTPVCIYSGRPKGSSSF